MKNILVKIIPSNKKKGKSKTKIVKNMNKFVSFAYVLPINRICYKCIKCFQKNNSMKKYLCSRCKIVFTNKHKKIYIIFDNKNNVLIETEHSFPSEFDNNEIPKSIGASTNNSNDFYGSEESVPIYSNCGNYEEEKINKTKTFFCNRRNSPIPYPPLTTTLPKLDNF
jgi:hypothetical protein